jgi:hypothetical protein
MPPDVLEAALPGCVFCGRPVTGSERCPVLPSSHWLCCGCEAPTGVIAPPGRPATTNQDDGHLSTRPQLATPTMEA